MPVMFLKLLTSRSFWVVLAVTTVIGSIYFWHSSQVDEAYERGVETTTSEYESRLAILRDNHRQRVIEIERGQAEAVNAVAADYEERLADVQSNADNLIDDLRADDLSLRGRFACPPAATPGRLPETAANSSQRDAPGDGGLRRADAEFLVRLAERADKAVARLTACQDILKTLQH